MNEIEEKIRSSICERELLEARSTLLEPFERDRLIHLCDLVCELKLDLGKLSRSSTETEYLTNTADVLFKYYDQVDNGSSPCTRPTVVGEAKQVAGIGSAAGKKSILQYFLVKPPSQETESIVSSTRKLVPTTTTTMTTLGKEAPIEDRAALMEMYWSRVDGDRMSHSSNKSLGDQRQGSGIAANKHYAPPKAGSDACTYCGGTERTVVLQDGCSFCNACHTVEYIIVDHDRPSYKDPPKEVTFFAYKRINHFNEWLNQVQGKETTEVPEEIYDMILLEIKKRKMTNMADLTHKRLKDILKKLRANRYYEHIAFLINRLNGLPIPHLSNELEERLRSMFCEIQVPFLRHKPPGRANFLSYAYCLNKLCYLLGEDQYLEGFPLLRNRDKLFVQESIWKNICADLGWTFYKSM